MRLHRLLFLAAATLLALVTVACSQQAEATDADGPTDEWIGAEE